MNLINSGEGRIRAKGRLDFGRPLQKQKVLLADCYFAVTTSNFCSITPISGLDMNCFQTRPVR